MVGGDGGEGGGHTLYSACTYLTGREGGGHTLYSACTWLSNTLNALKVLFQLINSFDVTR